MVENESSSFQPVSGINHQQLRDMEERIFELERRVDEMSNLHPSSTPTKPITQEDVVNVLNLSILLVGAACIFIAILFWIDIFLLSSSPNTDSADFDMSLIMFFSGVPLVLFGWFKGFSKIITSKPDET